MCLAVPMKVTRIEGHRLACSAMGSERWADMTLYTGPAPQLGDYVTVQLGFLQRVVPEDEAREALALFDEILEVIDPPARAG